MEETFAPIAADLQKAAMEQQVNAAIISGDFGKAAKDILINYGCEPSCLADIPLDIITVAQASQFCECPIPVEVKLNVNSLRRLDVSKVLKSMGVPYKIQNRKKALNLVSPEVIAPSYFSQGNLVVLAALAACGYVYTSKTKKASSKQGEEMFTVLV